jgi:MFS transporter, putative metabolite transport protein
MASASLIDDARTSGFHRKLTLYSSGGPFIDAYVLSIIGVALSQADDALSLSSVETGLIGASALVGIFFGGLVFGYVTDRVGRQTMYTVDLLALIVGSILCLFVTEVWQLLALRFVLGLAIGADYPIATSLLAEFVPRRGRGFLLGALTLAWAAGAVTAYLVGYAMLGLGDDAWRWMLATPAIPGIATVLLRLGTPESPRWLLSKGRVDEAREVVREVYGPEARIEDLPGEEAVETDFGKVWRQPYLNRMIFAGLYWMLQVTPLYAVLTYGPSIFEELGFGSGNQTYIVAAVIEIAFLVGTVPAMFASERFGRRPMSLWCFSLMAVGLTLAAAAPGQPAAVLIGFGAYALFSGGPFILQWIYPNEIFPTDVRATAFGIATAVSRIGAASGTFLVPLLIDGFGISATLFIAVALTLAGLLVTWAMAPETKDLSLVEAAGAGGTYERRKADADREPPRFTREETADRRTARTSAE